jgi:hypothetical protein
MFGRRKHNLINTATGEVRGSMELSSREAMIQNITVVPGSNGGRKWVPAEQSEWDYDPSDAAVEEFLANL